MENKSDVHLTNRASRELVDLWRSGSEEAARVLLARYEIRLIALVAARLNRKYRDTITPEDVVQSAMGSFFRVTRANVFPSLKLESATSAWNLLATFARRKLARALERALAVKRGGGQTRVSLDAVDLERKTGPSATEADEILADVRALLDQEQLQLLELLLENATQKDIAERLSIDERTVRRRIVTLRELISGPLATDDERQESSTDFAAHRVSLPNVSYRQLVLGKLIGRGALGKVYRAALQSDGQIVAVKFMHRHLCTNSNSRCSLLREIDQASKINHRGVVKYLGWGQSPHGGPYLVCEYIDGLPIATITPHDASASVRWMAQLCSAVAASHQAGVVHGDLTPNNILLARDGRLVVTDFGFATCAHAHSAERTARTSIESLGGTLGFAAPCASGKPAILHNAGNRAPAFA